MHFSGLLKLHFYLTERLVICFSERSRVYFLISINLKFRSKCAEIVFLKGLSVWGSLQLDQPILRFHKFEKAHCFLIPKAILRNCVFSQGLLGLVPLIISLIPNYTVQPSFSAAPFLLLSHCFRPSLLCPLQVLLLPSPQPILLSLQTRPLSPSPQSSSPLLSTCTQTKINSRYAFHFFGFNFLMLDF